MRFTAEGPEIPNELLTLRDEGEVVFFCGAGLSIPAGLPSFFELTKLVMSRVGVSPASKVGHLMAEALLQNDADLAPPLDQIFRMLQREYTAERIDREVTSLLRVPRKADVSNHDVVLRLSTDASGAPFVVTTNFDLMFERASRGLRRWMPPTLPSMIGDQSHSGVVYLHGRLPTDRGNSRDPSTLVLGSGDFGRAYLADGWATTFIRQLLERRIVVLLGYSAGDPPIRYLLEGLEASTSAKLKTIYAFDRGDENEVLAKWRDIGVVGIPFGRFSDLWSTLQKWADRADEPDNWKSDAIALARRSPRELLPFQRGQVVSLVSTTEGAKAFAAASPPPLSEWLCVFDKAVRFGEPGKEGWGEDSVEIDPLDVYGLDDDPARPDPSDKSAQVQAIDALATLPADGDSFHFARLSGIPNNRRSQLPVRLRAISSWFESIAHEPCAIWWAARQRFLDPELMWGINRRLSGHGIRFDSRSRRAWTILRELNSEQPDDIRDRSWFDFVAMLRDDGWTRGTLRFFEETVRPRLALDPPVLRSPIPPISGVPSDLSEMLNLDVKVPDRHEPNIDIPDSMTPSVFRVLRRTLESAISLLEETSASRYFHLPAIEPDDRPGERFARHEGLDGLFLWVVQIFNNYLELFPAEAKKELSAWPENDRFFFDKLRIFAWQRMVFSGGEVAIGIVGLSQGVFWDAHLQREVLHLLKARWSDFSVDECSEIQARILKGREKYESEPEDEFRLDAMELSAVRLAWLSRNGCDLSVESKAFLQERRRHPNWRTVWEEHAADDTDGRSGWIERRKDVGGLLESPLGEVVASAANASGRDREAFVEYAPFEGLVRERPLRALSSLSLEARRGKYPSQFWQQLLSDWPEEVPYRLLLLCAHRIARLPAEVVFELRFYIPGWVEKNLAPSSASRTSVFFLVWDSIFAKLNASGDQATKSSVGEIRVGGRIVKRSRKTLDYAINAPVGKLVDALFIALGDRKFSKDEGLPVDLTVRLERALAAVGEGSDHAASLLGRRLAWLFSVDSSWVRKIVLPNFKMGSPLFEAAWSGFLFTGQAPQSPELFDLIKVDFLNITESQNGLLQDDQLERQAAAILVVATYWNKSDLRYLTNMECRRALQSMSETGRVAALSTVRRIVREQDAWRPFGKVFFADIWPQEALYQTGTASEAMLRIAEDRPERFPEVIQTVSEYLRPIDHPDLFVFRQRRDTGSEGERASLMKRWPLQVLDVANRVIAKEPKQIPYELAELLNDIAEHAPQTRSMRSWRRLHELVSK